VPAEPARAVEDRAAGFATRGAGRAKRLLLGQLRILQRLVDGEVRLVEEPVELRRYVVRRHVPILAHDA